MISIRLPLGVAGLIAAVPALVLALAARTRWVRSRRRYGSRPLGPPPTKAFVGRHVRRCVAVVLARGNALADWIRPGDGPVGRTAAGVGRVLWWLAFPLRRYVGFDRVLVGAEPIRRAFADDVVHTVYAGQIDALAVRTVLAENDPLARMSQRGHVELLLTDLDDRFHVALHEVAVVARLAVSAGAGRLDAVNDLIVPACRRAVTIVFGCDDRTAADLYRCGELFLHRVFQNPATPAMRRDWLAEIGALQARDAFDRLLRETAAGTAGRSKPEPGGALALTAAAVERDDIDERERLGQLAGLTISVGPHLAWAAAHVLDELLRHRDGAAWHAAPAPQPGGRDDAPPRTDERVRLVLEALRLAPPTSALVRRSWSTRPLGSRPTSPLGRRARRLGPGVVIAMMSTHDLDRRSFRRPYRFRPDRFASGPSSGRRVPGAPPHDPRELPPLSAFSFGLHQCPGRNHAVRLVVELLTPLLAQDGVRRARGRSGQLSRRLPSYSALDASGSWPLPTSLVVTYDEGVQL